MIEIEVSKRHGWAIEGMTGALESAPSPSPRRTTPDFRSRGTGDGSGWRNRQDYRTFVGFEDVIVSPLNEPVPDQEIILQDVSPASRTSFDLSSFLLVAGIVSSVAVLKLV